MTYQVSVLKAVLLKQNKISRYLISTPHWIYHKFALTPSDYPSPVIGAGKALLRRSSSRAKSEATFASGEGKEAFPSSADPKASYVCALCFQSFVKMAVYYFLNLFIS